MITQSGPVDLRVSRRGEWYPYVLTGRIAGNNKRQRIITHSSLEYVRQWAESSGFDWSSVRIQRGID